MNEEYGRFPKVESLLGVFSETGTVRTLYMVEAMASDLRKRVGGQSSALVCSQFSASVLCWEGEMEDDRMPTHTGTELGDGGRKMTC